MGCDPSDVIRLLPQVESGLFYLAFNRGLVSEPSQALNIPAPSSAVAPACPRLWQVFGALSEPEFPDPPFCFCGF